MNLHLLHGFLGFSSDWEIFRDKFEPNFCKSYCIEQFLPNFIVENYFQYWAKEFNKNVFQHNSNSNKKNILIGYSLGGRLALHSLAEQHSWDGVIIISANPGLSNHDEKIARIQNDEKWGNRFLNEPWDTVMKAWNSQGVFSGQKNNLNREEKLYNKNIIHQEITGFSLGKQENLRPLIKDLKIPSLWISGELDTKFALIGKEIPDVNKNIKSIIIPNVGHRVPWESSDKFVEICRDFFNTIQQDKK